jgi:hypothetical protein
MKSVRKKLSKRMHKEMAAIQRELKREQGFFDGRFRTKTVESKKTYSRKVKHKNTN